MKANLPEGDWSTFLKAQYDSISKSVRQKGGKWGVKFKIFNFKINVNNAAFFTKKITTLAYVSPISSHPFVG